MKKKTLFIATYTEFEADKWELFVSEKGREMTDFKKFLKDEYNLDEVDDIDIFPIEKEMDANGKEYKIKVG